MTLRTYEPRIEGDDPELDALIERYASDRGAVIPLLQAVQELNGHLSTDALERISVRTRVPVSRLLGVATFYAQFRLVPVGKHIVRMCHGTACHVAGTQLVQQALEDELGIEDGGTTDDGLFTLSKVACLGCCSLAPAMMIGTEVHGRLTPDSARRVVRRIRKAEAKAKAQAEGEAPDKGSEP